MPQTILLATDGRAGCLAAADRAIALAAERGAELVVLNVRPPVGADPGPPRFLSQLADRAKSAGVPARALVRVGEPGAEIVDAARESNADLIVVGHDAIGVSNRRGSVAGHVTRCADRPVLVVQPWARSLLSAPASPS
jgi:nucleotide-binding universal stress UspA family protein